MKKNSFRSTSLRGVDIVPGDDLSQREVSSGGSPRSGGSFRLSAAVAAEREETRKRLSKELYEGNMDDKKEEDEDNEEEEDEDDADSGSPAGQPMRMSLMDLLEETDRQAGISGPTYRLDDDEELEEEEEEFEEEEEDDDGRGEYTCCVCNVKHKGSAFVRCGHTFCRLCSRELMVEKGHCPHCNDFILEILDIF